jgi:hypothetical protein
MSTTELRKRQYFLSEMIPDLTVSESEVEVHDIAKSKQLERRRSSISDVVDSTFLKKRLSRQSSLSWGHKRSLMIGLSCFLFLLPIPLLLKSCCRFAAFMLAVVTVSSFCSDYVYTGVDSWSHLLDRTFAPIALISNIYAVYSLFGIKWTLPAVLAVKCHILAIYQAKINNYEKFVVFHSLWHATGVGLILLSFAVNGLVECGGSLSYEEIN